MRGRAPCLCRTGASVRDAAAKLTTSTFEAKRLDPTIGRAEALRKAMVAYIADTSDAWSAYPAFWAPFVVAGEGGL